MKTYKYGQELPAEVESKLDAYIERVKAIKWFKPSASIDKSAVKKQVSVVLKAFGVEASLEYRTLKTPQDWDAAWGAARDAARDAAWGAARDAARDADWGAARDADWGAAWGAARDAAWDAARDAAWGAARDAAWGAAWGAAWDAAWGAADLLSQQTPTYKNKSGTFLHLIPLYELGLWPLGVVDGKFVVAVTPCKLDFPEIK